MPREFQLGGDVTGLEQGGGFGGLPSGGALTNVGMSGLALGPMGASASALGGSGGIGGLVDTFTGRSAADAALEAGRLQAAAAREGIGEIRAGQGQALGMLSPFQQAGAGQLPGITSLVSDPTAQAAFIQDNPFFQSLAGQASQSLMANQAAKGKVGSGGTAAALQERMLGLGSNLLNQNITQRMGLAQMGAGAAGQSAGLVGQTSGSIADLIGSAAAAQAAGQVGAANAESQGLQNMISTGLGIAALSDRRLKKDIQRMGENKGLPVYRFKYLWDTEDQIGYMAQDVEELFPELVVEKSGIKYIKGEIYAH
jgi:hypothetical protein